MKNHSTISIPSVVARRPALNPYYEFRREPDPSISVIFPTVPAVALLNSESNRHKAEEQMAKYSGERVVSWHLNYSFNENDEAARATIIADGFDGAITMRPRRRERNHPYTRQYCHLPTVLSHLRRVLYPVQLAGISRRPQLPTTRRFTIRNQCLFHQRR